MKQFFSILALTALLAACGEKVQSLDATSKSESPYAGAAKAFVDPDWKPGDKAAWESHLKTRTQQGQNDYLRMN